MKLSAKEEKIMALLWEREGKTLSTKEMVEEIGREEWNPRSIYSIVNSLLKKGMIEECGSVKSATNTARVFRARVKKTEYFLELLNRKENMPEPVYPFLASLINGATDPKKLETLEEMIRRRKEELK